MRFNDSSPIYEQIADDLAAQAVSGALKAGDRLPSARDLAVSLQVNPNTAARALQTLADRGVARCERGTGYFVAETGPDVAARERKARFFQEDLPRLFRKMEELGIEIDTIRDRWAARIAGGSDTPGERTL